VLDLVFELKVQDQINDGYVVDFSLGGDIPIANIAIEIDGHEWHEKSKEQAKRDKERGRYLLRSGYPEVRFTGSEVYTQPVGAVKETLDTFAMHFSNICVAAPETYYEYAVNINIQEQTSV
jgi:very-short-patch-repair endonuclease